VLRRPRFTQQVWREHAAILAAMAQGQPEEAARLIGEHVGVAHQRVREELIALGVAPNPGDAAGSVVPAASAA
jgi:DNA-binding GntR family transcriptional regulator